MEKFVGGRILIFIAGLKCFLMILAFEGLHDDM